ncbi:hypothetical protein EDB85DRAFT_1907269 [Lactarius pseudohatsudake]|nr:hypothetical protein EDB85DRAFT_1907269 [Lactarius pseudohatsudake]
MGLGVRTLAGVEDKDVYPVRGQTVLLRAPRGIQGGKSLVGGNAYVIPRRDDTVIVGGTRVANDWCAPKAPDEVSLAINCRVS